MSIEFKQLSIGNGREEYDMLQDIDKDEYGFTNEVKGMTYSEYQKWLVFEQDISESKNLPDNWIPQTTYFLYINGKPVGIARIRHHSSEALEQQGVGNFGYGIAKSSRGKGYGNVLFQEILKKCKDLGYSKIRSFVKIDNLASNRVFQSNGAKLVGQFGETKNIYETSL